MNMHHVLLSMVLQEFSRGNRPAWQSGQITNREDLLAVVYDELRRIASKYLREDRRDHTLQPTALVHEAYLRIVDQDIEWKGEEHFIGIAAMMMRRVLMNYAKSRNRLKRGGRYYKIAIDAADIPGRGDAIDLTDLDAALTRLSDDHSTESKIVELRFFGGLSIAETARVLRVSESTVERNWKFARAWLRRELCSNNGEPCNHVSSK